jgi:hypothetical protein
MAVRYFKGRTQAWLESELRSAQEELAAGRVTTSVSAGDTETEETIEVNVKERIELLLEELNRLDPVTYPSSMLAVRRTTPRYIL